MKDDPRLHPIVDDGKGGIESASQTPYRAGAAQDISCAPPSGSDPSKRLACIDVGSGALEMIIVETDGKKTRALETLRQGVALGRDSYSHGVISRDAIRETCHILGGFHALIDEYKVDSLSVVATSAIREAANRDWVLDQIFLTTGFEVQVLNNAQEVGMMFAALRDVPDFERLRRDGVLIIDVGYGSTEITEIRDGELILSRNVKVGALRLWELIAANAYGNPRYSDLMEQYITAQLHHIRDLTLMEKIRHCIALSGEAERLIAMMDAHPTLKRYNQLYHDVKRMTTEQMEMTYGVPRERGEILLPTMMVIKAFIEMTRADALNLYSVTLKDGVIASMREEIFHPDTASKAGDKDKLSMARSLAAAQNADLRHASDVERKAIKLFEALSNLHGMGAREKLLLRLAATTHDMGKRISSFEHGAQSAHILLANPIVGLDDEEQNILAFIVEYHSTRKIPSGASSYQVLGDRSRIYAIKMLSILLLADALDAGYAQKLTIESAALDHERFIIRARTTADASFESWVFESKSALFSDVFGIRAELRIKKNANQ